MEYMEPEDYESVVRAGRILHGRGWLREFSANEMTGAWSALVAEIEAGYDQAVDEYTNALTCRDWLSLAWPMFTAPVRRVRQAELDSLDARFIAATEEDTDSRLAQFHDIVAEDGWWWRRIPSRRQGAFARELGV